MDLNFLWTGWSPILHTLLVGTVGYLTLVILLRGTGPHTMSKMTPLDFVLGVTLGSAFGRVITAAEVSLTQAIVALVLLVTVQWVLGAARAKWRFVRGLVDSPPVLIYYDGRMQLRALRQHRLTQDDVHATARRSGHGSLADIHAVILFQDGTLGVIARGAMGDGSSVMPFIKRNQADAANG